MNTTTDTRDRTPRYAPESVIVISGGKPHFAKVQQYAAHPPGNHPDGCPIDRKLFALAMVTQYGTAWRGFDNAYINAELRMVVEGFDSRDEVVSKWAPVRLPTTQRAGDDRPEVLASRKLLAEVDAFTAGYIECALFCGVELPEDHPDADRDKDSGRIPEDIDAETLADMIADCAKFRTPEVVAAIEGAEEAGLGDDDDAMTKAGRDFWYTRNGHGVGFWEESRWPEPFGAILDKAAKAFGECDLYTGDDGRIYAM